MNAQSRLIEEALMRQGIPYAVVGGVGFYERREVKDLLAYLRLVLNPADRMALRRVLNVPAARHRRQDAGGDRARGRGERGVSLWDALGVVEEERAAARARHPAPRAASAS